MRTLALTKLIGLPIVVWGGLTTLLIFLFAAYIGYSNRHGKHTIPFKWHPRVVTVAFVFAIVHAIFGLSVFLTK